MQKQCKNKCHKKCCCIDYKILLIILCILTAIILLVVSAMAYFSDVVVTSGTATAGTLDITGQYQFYLNGNPTPITDLEINNFNPGDVLVARATISNTGNKSAWIRNVVDFSNSDDAIMAFTRLYEGELTLEDILDGATPLVLDNNIYVSPARIIDGMAGSQDQETETGDDAIGSDTVDVAYTIYFDIAADNTAQGQTIDLAIRTQAIQYRNNTTTPTEETWNTVVTTPFSYTP